MNKPATHCKKCGVSLHDVSLTKRQDGTMKKMYGALCKRCSNDRRNKKRHDMIDKCIEYKGGECQDCHQKYDRVVYDFHHLGDKTDLVSSFIYRTQNFDDIKPELDKCVLLCSNCHRIRHKKRPL